MIHLIAAVGRHLTLRAAVALCLIAVLTGCTFSPPTSPQAPPQFSGKGEHSVWIVNHGWHTGVIVSAEAVESRLPGLRERFPEADYLEFGWGDRDYYQALDESLATTVKAALWPTPTVVRLMHVPHPSNYRANEIVGLCASAAELAGLVDFLGSSFASEDEGASAMRGSTGGRSQFYEATGSYHLLNTCNSWTARALASMGLDLFTGSKLTSGSVMDYLREHPQATRISASTAVQCASRQTTAEERL